MKQTTKYIIFLFALILGSSNGWAIDEGDIIINVLPNSSAGTVTVSNISGRTVTITATPATGYSIDATHILVEKMVNASSRRSSGLSSKLDVTAEGSNNYSFVIPDDYDGAYVTANFFKTTANGITSLSQINSMGGTYVLTADIDASSLTASLGNFTGTLDGGFYKIYNLSVPLFTSTSGDAVIRNITFEAVDISISGNAGAVTGSAAGNTRIYNCGILPSSVERDDAGNVSGFYGSSVGSSDGYCGGLVGLLDGNARVINCYSYATIKAGTTVGGIVGYNNGTSSQSGITTMVMNCMFYGDITGGSTVSPVYGGNNINNKKASGTAEDPHGLATYNYYAYSQLKSKTIEDADYHCTLGAEERYLVRDVLYRQLLNSNKKLAAKYASIPAGETTPAIIVNPTDMAKWVYETADRTIINPCPYPVLKTQGRYPSIINIDIENAPDSASVGRLNGGRLEKTLSVKIDGVGANAPADATLIDKNGNAVESRTLNMIRTDKDTTRFNFNYDKIQLPYYNDVGTKNYTKNKVVTGWIITEIDGGTSGTFTEADEWGGYNFADRRCTNKDLYSDSHRVFSQGAYFDVPYGVTGITIKPYWGEAVYVSDQYYDVVYNQVGTNNKSNYSAQNVNVSSAGLTSQYTFNKVNNIYQANVEINGEIQIVYTSISDARGKLTFSTGETVYDNAVVLVGNVHQAGPLYGDSDTPYTIMSIDLDKDNEPDHSFIFSHCDRKNVSSIRFDFLNMIGTAEAQKPNGATQLLNVSIFNPKGWFEVTNTCTTHITQFEADNSGKNAAPVIFLGGVIDQYTSTKVTAISTNTYNHKTKYIHLGSNVCFKEFGNGTHSDGYQFTDHVPVSVTGGDFEGFYLSGVYRPDAIVKADDAEGYISGGRFKEMAGASQQMIEGNVKWQIYDADITNFYGGGINADKPITGSITTDIINSHVGTFCGGPKFGDMQKAGTTLKISYNSGNRNKLIENDGIVTTNAVGCTFGTFFGAGYGGASSLKLKFYDSTNPDFSTLITNYNNDRGKYYDGNDNTYNTSYGKKGPGVATDFDYEFFVWSSGAVGARFYVNYTTFSLAKTRNVNSTLTKCTVEKNFYGGGSLGVVDGTATSVLDNCKINGSVYGGGFSASIPTVPVRDNDFKKTPAFNGYAGIFDMGEKNGTQDYKWKEGTLTKNSIALDGTDIFTDANLATLGQVDNSDLLIKGTTTIVGGVFGGGDESRTNGTTKVTIEGGIVDGNVYGGGNVGDVGDITTSEDLRTFTWADGTGECEVNITGGTVGGNVFGAGRGVATSFECEKAMVKATTVSISNGTVNGNVYGGGEIGRVETDTKVMIGLETTGGETPTTAIAPKIMGNVFGAGAGIETHGYSALVRGNTQVTIQNKAVVGNNVYGGGEIASVGNYGLKNGYPSILLAGGECQVNIQGEAKIGTGNTDDNGNVFGASKGVVAHYDPDNNDKSKRSRRMMKYVANLYPSGKENQTWEYYDEGHHYVWEYFDEEAKYLTFLETLALATSPIVTVDESASVHSSVFGGGELGITKGSVIVNIKGGTVGKDVYGGGALADTNTTSEVGDKDSNDKPLPADSEGNYSTHTVLPTTAVNLTGGTIERDVYGGGLGRKAAGTEGEPDYVPAIAAKVYGNTSVELNGTVTTVEGGGQEYNDNCVVKGCIFGCNNLNGSPLGTTTVHVYKTADWEGHGKTPSADLTSTIASKHTYNVAAVYGGGNQAAYEPSDLETATTRVIIDGCERTSIKQVYGGGNAASTPATYVEINGTHEIEEVFGGGNGKDAIGKDADGHDIPNPGANVGFYDYSAVEDTYDTKDKRQQTEFKNTYTYGTGKASVNIFGGTIHRVFGGSNTKGNVRQTAVTMLEEASGCDFCVDEAYGGGKSAPMDAEAKLLMACIPGLQAAYGGAEAADIKGNVTLNITNGTFDRVFGGNNLSGTISGSIVVNVSEVGCRPIIIGELYGGGNQAAYSVYGYDNNNKAIESGTTPLYLDPQVNVKSFTSIGNIYGGGYGKSAVMVGNPKVNISEVVGSPTTYPSSGTYFDGTGYKGQTITLESGTVNEHKVTMPKHTQGKIGAINSVFGGGNAAKVIGDTYVNIGTLTDVYEVVNVAAIVGTTLPVEGKHYYILTGAGTPGSPYTYAEVTSGTIDADVTYYEKKDVIGVDIRGNVYGGGNKAEVTGGTHVQIGKNSE